MIPRPPLFILTCMRSYSSLVSAMLGQHPGLYCLPEVNPFIADTVGAGVDVLNVVRKRTLDGLYRAVAELEYGAQSEAAVQAAQGFVGRHRDFSPVELMAWFAAKVAPRRLIEKSPSTVLNPDRLAAVRRLFPDAMFLHLYRHPLSTTASIAKITQASAGANGKGPRKRSARDPEDAWYGANADILKFGFHIGVPNFMSVRGEDVLDDPDNFLSQICAWLGLECRAQDLAAMKQPQNSPYAMVGPPSAPFGADPAFLKHPEYVRREIVLPPLDSQLDWATPGRRLRQQTVELAYQLGYQ